MLSAYAKSSTFVCQVQKDVHHSRESKHLQLIPEMLSTMDDWLRNDDGLTASILKAKSLQWCTNFPNMA